MKRPADVRQLLQRSFTNQHRNWLNGGEWPLVVSLGTPSEAEALRQPDAVRSWAAEWRTWRGAGEVGWVARQWRTLGTQELPSRLVLAGPEAVALWAGQQDRWARAQLRHAKLTERWPALGPTLGKLFDMLADYADEDFQRLMATVSWIVANPESGLYLRQLPVSGLDSKWIEPRRWVVAELVAALGNRPAAGQDFYALCGLKRQPQQLRLRLLDPRLRQLTGGLGDLTAPIDELARLPVTPRNVLIVENLQTGLALPDLPRTAAIMGLGYAVQLLEALPWLRGAGCLYWGDVDTHGLAILSRARTYVPQLQSVLMDEDTLLAHRPLWTVEAAQHGAADLAQLDATEADLYAKLKNNFFAQGVRLEQERIDWTFAMTRLKACLGGDVCP